jgi:hypothetical protein
LIIYRKTQQLRIERNPVPQPPFWSATTIAPYSARRAAPVAIDYLELRASFSERMEVAVCDKVQDELERAWERAVVVEPALIESAEFAESIFRRGQEILRFCCEHDSAALHLISTRGTLPQWSCERAVVVISAWPLDFSRLESLAAEASGRHLNWGVAVPVIFPVTTDLVALREIAALAHEHGAMFLAALSLELDATARHALARTLTDPGDEETYDLLFHADLEPIHVATERHVAALAAEIGIADFIVLPRWEQKSNWNAAVMLTLAATRMLAMKQDVELASRMARSARAVAQLEKPIERIAAAASLSIVEALDEVSVDALTDWIESGRSAFAEHINKQWRLRRDAGLA